MLTIFLPLLAATQTVSFTCRAEPMVALVPDLGKAIGRKLAVSEECESDVMLISAKDVSANRLLDEIARIDAAQWEQKADSLELVPDRPARTRQESEAERRRVDSMQKAIDAYLHKRMDELKKLEAQADQEDESSTPSAAEVEFGAKLHHDLVSLLMGVDLSAVSRGFLGPVVYSTHPNAVQLPLGPDADQTIQAILQASSAYMTDPAARSEAQANGDSVPKPVTSYFKADVSVQYEGLDNIPDINISLYDASGRAIFLQGFNSGDQILARAAKPQVPAGQATPIEHDPATIAYARIERDLRAGHILDAPLPPTLAPFLTDPMRHDPLSLIPSDQLMALGNAKGKPLVALVPDDAMTIPSVQRLRQTEEDFESTLQDVESPLSMKLADGWIEVSPSDPADSRESRMDRRAFADLLAISRKQGVPTLDDVATFASKMSLDVSNILWMFVPDIEPEVRAFGFAGTNAVAARVWYELDPVRRQAMLNGGVIPLAALSSDVSDTLAELLYSGTDSLVIDSGPNAGAQSPDATQILPNGIPLNAYLTVKAHIEPCVCVSEFWPSDVMILSALKASSVANMLFRHETTANAVDPASLKSFWSMRVGVRTTYEFEFHLAPGWKCVAMLKDDRFPPDGEKVSLNSLPSDFQAALQSALADLRAGRAASQQGDAVAGGQASPPPP